jgi:hypothetical protein
MSMLHWNVNLAKTTFLVKIEHCKASRVPQHEFVLAYFVHEQENGRTFETCIILDRCPSQQVNSTTSFPWLHSITHTQATLAKKGQHVAADDRAIIPKNGSWNGLIPLVHRLYGPHEILTTVSDTRSMTAYRFARLIGTLIEFAPDYTFKKHQCYWHSFMIVSLVKSETGGKETSGDKISQRGTLFGFAPPHDPRDDETAMKYEYKVYWLHAPSSLLSD